jgi:hypothetical protein
MRRAIKIVMFVVVVLLAAVQTLFTYSSDGDSRRGRTKAELQTLSGAMRGLIHEKFNSEEELKTIHSMQDVASTLGNMIEGNSELLDPWGNQYCLDTREDDANIIFTIFSSHPVSSRWFERKRKVLGVEIIVAKQTGIVIATMPLWN